MFWSWFRQVGNDTHDIHIDLSFTWQVLLLNYLSEQSMQWWGSSNGTRTRSPQTRTPGYYPPWTLSPGQHSPASIPPWTTSPGHYPPMGNIPPDNIPPWTICPMDNIPPWIISHRVQYPLENTYPNFSLKIVKYNRIEKQCLSKKNANMTCMFIKVIKLF